MERDEFKFRAACSNHSKVDSEITDIKDALKDHRDCLSILKTSKVSVGVMTWTIGIALLISLAVVGFLWKAQNTLADKISEVQDFAVSRINEVQMSSDIKRDVLADKIDNMNATLIEIRTKLEIYGDRKN